MNPSVSGPRRSPSTPVTRPVASSTSTSSPHRSGQSSGHAERWVDIREAYPVPVPVPVPVPDQISPDRAGARARARARDGSELTLDSQTERGLAALAFDRDDRRLE